MAYAKTGSSKLKKADQDLDQDETGELDVEHFPLPKKLLQDAGLEEDGEEDEDA